MPGEMDLGPRLSGRLTYLLKQALVDLEALHEQHLGPSGITARELTVLLFLDGREPESQQEAAAHLGVDRTTMVGLLDALEAKDLVARHPDPADRRRNVVALTDPGRKTLRKATRASDAAERQLLAELSDREAAQLRELLRRLASSGPARA
jgi:DNA-binding MarR family transcriptional regulator